LAIPVTYNQNPGDFDGGSSNPTGNIVDLPGGSSKYQLLANPAGTGGTANAFLTEYTNLAKIRPDLERVEATFKRFNEPPTIQFVKESFEVISHIETLDFLNLANFFHPIQNFSDFQKQTFVIGPESSVNIDPGDFSTTRDEISMLFARAFYLPETSPPEQILFWDYKANNRNVMGQFMVLTGAVKNGLSWYGWDVNPYPSWQYPIPANGASGGFTFTNPTPYAVKLSILISS
jgi:hypothetical protein